MSEPRRRQVAVSGGAADPPEDVLAAAEEVGRRLAEAGITLVCGGLGGVMDAAARGAAEAGGVVVGIVPGADPADANPHCTHVVATGIGHARNLAVVASGDAVIAIGGEWGTLSEIAFARRLGRPVVALQTWTVRGIGPMAEAPGIMVAGDPAEAVAAVQEAMWAIRLDFFLCRKCFHTWRVRLVDDDWRVAAQMVERFTDLNDDAKRLFATPDEGLNR